jgi:hypothetical protein
MTPKLTEVHQKDADVNGWILTSLHFLRSETACLSKIKINQL